jgi:Putative beta-barrel porin-2, OmpL-like. bbp2
MQKQLLHKIHITCTALAITGIAPGYAFAADPAPAAPAGPKLSDVLDASGIAITGYVAASYYHSSGYSTFHQFDIEHDTFQLDQAGVTIAYQPKEGFGALVNIIGGEDARVINAAENGTNSTVNVTQAFVQYATGPVTVMAGKFVTLAGAEVIAPTGNTNFSRSLLFFAEPLTHTGIRAAFAATDTVTLTVGVNNGWNTTSTSYGSKTGELGIGFIPNKIFSLTAQAYIGKVPTYDANRTLVDLVASYNATSALSFVLSYDWGKQQQADVGGVGSPDLKWNGVAGYANFAINDQMRVSLRGELLDDKDGFNTGTPQKVKEGTATFGYSPVKSFELRAEFRYDKSNAATFVNTVHGTAQTFEDHQTGVALQGLYKF